MINTQDILETINMIREENLDIRTITMGISLWDCVSEDTDRLCQRIYDKITRRAEHLVRTGAEIEKMYIRNALEQICSISLDDDVSFEIGDISPIREDDLYGGYRVMVKAKLDTMLTPLSIDVSTGDVMTPDAIQYNFSEIFDDEKSYELWAYNIETVMAEKVETILRRGVFNTRPRDFYDTYILATTQKFNMHGI